VAYAGWIQFLAKDGTLADTEAAALKEIERDLKRHPVIPGRERSERTWKP
jgi:hypothetical protein